MKANNSFYLNFKVLPILLVVFIVIPGCARTMLVQITQKEIQQYQNLKEGSLALRTHRLTAQKKPKGRVATALKCAGKLKDGDYETANYGWMGAKIKNIPPALVKELSLNDDSGALVEDVRSGGPADKGDIQGGDIIVNFGGQQVINEKQLAGLIENTTPNTDVGIDIIRGGKTLTVNIHIAALKDNCYFDQPFENPFAKEQGQLTGSLRVALVNLGKSQLLMAKALGLDEEVMLAKNQIKSLEEGDLGTSDEVDKAVEISASVQDAIDKAIVEKTTLDAGSKAVFASAVPFYVKGVLGTIATGATAYAIWQSMMGKLDFSIIYKAAALYSIITNVPTLVSQLSTSTGQITDFMSANDIDNSEMEKQLANKF
tara:strand:+ start:6088 stop:7203 length:1116 start_codon:yes stop_codon:yes gene_type:complete